MSKEVITLELRELYSLIRRQIENSKKKGIDPDITGMHIATLMYLFRNNGKDIFQRDFEQAFSIRRSTATNILQRMQKSGLIMRNPVDYDARLKKIVLTEKAVEVHNTFQHAFEDFEKQILRGLSDEEVDGFLKIIKKIKLNLQ